MPEAKQVIVARADLNMPPGKLAAQVAHASLGAVLQLCSDRSQDGVYKRVLKIPTPHPVADWFETCFTKVCLAVNSEGELYELLEKAKEAGLPCTLIVDSGRTIFNGVATATCLGIGPATVDEINKITGSLPLYR